MAAILVMIIMMTTAYTVNGPNSPHEAQEHRYNSVFYLPDDPPPSRQREPQTNKRGCRLMNLPPRLQPQECGRFPVRYRFNLRGNRHNAREGSTL